MRFYWLAVLLFGLPIQQLAAQTVPAGPDYARFYVGLSGMQGHYEVTYSRIHSYDEGVLSGGLTGGYQFAPRAAVQISFERSTDPLHVDFLDQNALGQTVRIGYYQENHQNFAIPVMLRLTGTRRLQHRLQFDALVGFVVVHASYRRIFAKVDEFQQATSYDEQAEQTTNLALSIGGGIRYRFGRRIEAVADANLNRTIGSAATSGFLSVYTVGLRYRFGYH